MTTECNQKTFAFHALGRREVVGCFDGGTISSDGGGVLLREVELRTGIIRQFAACFTDHRDPELIEHTVEELLAQRVYALALGYEDLIDHDDLRHDPLLAALVGKADPAGQQRRRKQDCGKALAGKSTLNPLELTPAGARKDNRYKKIVCHLERVEAFLVDVFLQAHAVPPERIVIDLDSTFAPAARHTAPTESWRQKRRGKGSGEKSGLSSTFALCEGLFMFVVRKKKGAALQVSWNVTTQTVIPKQGSTHEQYTTVGGAAALGNGPRFHATHVSTLHRSAVCCHSDYRAANGQQPAADGAGAGPRPSVQLPPGLLLAALYRSKDWNQKHKRRHKTPSELMRGLLAVLMHWFPQRKFIFSGDGGYGTHPLARFACRHRAHLTLVSRFYPKANLYAPPPAVKGKHNGRPRKKGRKLAAPEQVVSRSRRSRLTVAWYGGGQRRVEVVAAASYWYKNGGGLVPVRWVFVHDRDGTHRDEYFFTTDPALTPRMIIETYTGRWSIETAFQEMRAYLGLETTRGWSERTMLRAAPCLFGLYSVVALLYARLPANQTRRAFIQWPGKSDRTFSDAITAVRRCLWSNWVFATPDHHEAFSKLSRSIRAVLLYALAPAA